MVPRASYNTRVDEKPKRRWFRFGLTGLFAVTAMVAVALAIVQPWKSKVSIENRRLIVAGMSSEQVFELLGRPDTSAPLSAPPASVLAGWTIGWKYSYRVEGFQLPFIVIVINERVDTVIEERNPDPTIGPLLK